MNYMASLFFFISIPQHIGLVEEKKEREGTKSNRKRERAPSIFEQRRHNTEKLYRK